MLCYNMLYPYMLDEIGEENTASVYRIGVNMLVSTAVFMH